jgi:hypothetical protein
MITQEFLKNRPMFPTRELESYRGKWVAFSADGKRIVACAVTLETLRAEVEGAGENLKEVVLERIGEPDHPGDVYLGGAEYN